MSSSKCQLPKRYHSRRRPVTEEERFKAKEAAKNFKSNFPYAVIRMTSTTVYRMCLMSFRPSFCRAHLPQTRANLILRDPNGRAWVVACVLSTGGYLSKGWASFSRGNNLEEGDFCAFKIVGPVELRVHVFRVLEETTPLLKVS